MMSNEPPAGKGTTMRTGLAGNSCATAGHDGNDAQGREMAARSVRTSRGEVGRRQTALQT